jgi:phosphoribosylanthranilate isomerase
MFVKICGITRLEDAQAAVLHGAQALGFIFWPESPRFVTPDLVREIIGALQRPVTTVGVFVNQSAHHIQDVAKQARLAAVQLHGDETPAFAAELRLPVIKAVTFGEGAPSVAEWPSEVMLLADAKDPVRRGGTGVTADWPAAATLARARRLLLAGGLNPDNVAAAMARVQPYGIDVSSGVERSPGVKDHDKLAALFAAVRSATGEDLRSSPRS